MNSLLQVLASVICLVFMSAAVQSADQKTEVKTAVAPASKPGQGSVPKNLFAMPSTFPGPLLQEMLKGPLKEVQEIVFAVRVPGRDHWYVTFGNYADHLEDAQKRGFKMEEGVYWGYGEGAQLCRLNLRTGALKVILEDKKGGIRDPQMHYNGQKILFSYRKGGEHPFHLYEINVDGSGLRQLTDGPDDDIEPVYCPDGSIVFCSSRCRRFVNCWHTRVATLYRCEGDGRNVRMLSTNNDHDDTPWVLPDGRVLYMRWEYVDRSQMDFHHLWSMNPDGTSQTVYYGNMRAGNVMLDAKPIHGTDKVVSIFSPGHVRPEHLGSVNIIEPAAGPDETGSVRTINAPGRDWKDPYAISEDCFLVANPKGLFVMDGKGRIEMVFELPKSMSQLQCHEPRPLQGRPRENIIPSRVNLAQETGRLFLENIYEGRNMEGVKRGSIKKLLVLQQLPKPINFSGGMEPLTIGGSFTLAEIVGEVPVEQDGSAYMELPALRSLFFVALDDKEVSVKRMHSFVTLQPGETTGCVGCHEQRTQTPVSQNFSLLAMKRPPSPVKPITDVPSVLDFPRDIQPILDQHCVSCHNPDKSDGGVDLCGDKTPRYTMSYVTINALGLVSDGRNATYANRIPYSYGSANSRLLKLCDGSHYNAKPDSLQVKTLRLWIETSATYPGTYAALGCSYFPVSLPEAEIAKRCGECHAGRTFKLRAPAFIPQLTNYYSAKVDVFENISRPEKSLLLQAPLAQSAGGLGRCPGEVFKDKSDPVYQAILASLNRSHAALMEEKRFDMPGFRPNEHYIREMKRFGILPASLGPNDPINVYATDRAYWNSFYYRPPNDLVSADPTANYWPGSRD